jgi:hypothetical protein
LLALGLGKPTEMSLRDLLVEELKRMGVVVVPEVNFRTFYGSIKNYPQIWRYSKQLSINMV